MCAPRPAVFRGMQAYMKSAQAEGKHFPQPPKGLSPEQLYGRSLIEPFYGVGWLTVTTM